MPLKRWAIESKTLPHAFGAMSRPPIPPSASLSRKRIPAFSKADWIRIRVERADHWVRLRKCKSIKTDQDDQHPVMKSKEDSRLPLARRRRAAFPTGTEDGSFRFYKILPIVVSYFY